ncbi:type IV conjugative transfer system pilin TraA [Escherichia coli]
MNTVLSVQGASAPVEKKSFLNRPGNPGD